MPLVTDKSQTGTPWAGDKYPFSLGTLVPAPGTSEGLNLALVNNMPDSALEDTEEQFFELLHGASDQMPVHISLFSLPNIARSDRAQKHLDEFYTSTTELLGQRFDGAIITGTEPRQPNLKNEPYWKSLIDVIEWAEENTASTVLSCLAAHAGVLQSDGIARTPLEDKRFGVFEHTKSAEHQLTRGIAGPIRIPHSRWNEVREQALTEAGYLVLSKSERAGVDLFVKEKKKSLFVHFQGHPEYVDQTLYKEYKRDVKRFLRQERETYPAVPAGYFDAMATKLLDEFRQTATAQREEGLMEKFPETEVTQNLTNSWRPSASGIYRNWLEFVAMRKTSGQETFRMAHMANS
jgi:homoserine O-succinyltransferase/O-acetyltransferase